jgi:hypothetical protein
MRRLFFALAAGMMAVWLLLAGCSGDHATAGASTAGTGGSSASGMSVGAAAVQAYCDVTAEAFCEAYFACCTNPDLQMVATKEDCKRDFGAGGVSCLWAVGGPKKYAAAVDAGDLVLDQARLDAYVARFKSMSPGGAGCVHSALYEFISFECPAAFQGQIPVGGPCDGYGCAHGECDLSTHTCRPLAQLGEPCGVGNDFIQHCDWGEDLQCAPTPPPHGFGACVHQGDIGEPCAQGAECKSGNCDSTSGACVLPYPDSPCY